jgi:hypothetical protein
VIGDEPVQAHRKPQADLAIAIAIEHDRTVLAGDSRPRSLCR